VAPHRSEAGSSDSHFEDYWLFDRSSRTLKYVVGGGIGSALQIPSRRRSFSSNMLRKSSTSVVALDPEKPKWAQRKGIKVSRLTSMDSAQSRLDRPPDAQFGTQQTVGVGRSYSLMRCSAMNQRRPALNVTAHSWSVFPFCSSLRWIISVMTPRASRHCDDGQTTFTSSPTRSRFTEELQFLE